MASPDLSDNQAQLVTDCEPSFTEARITQTYDTRETAREVHDELPILDLADASENAITDSVAVGERFIGIVDLLDPE